MQINKATQVAILKAVDGLPPITWRYLCKTDDQHQHWRGLRDSYGLICEGLKDYFEGRASSLDSEMAISTIDYYISLYGVIQRGWHHIASVATAYKLSDFPETPGECIIKLIENDCAAFFVPCLAAHEWSKDAGYRFYLEEKKVRALLSSGKPLTKSEEAKVQRFSIKFQQMQLTYKDFLTLRHLCLAVCRDAQGDKSLQQKLEIFDRYQFHLHSLIAPKLRKGESYRWDGEGTKTTGTNPGGVYK